MKILLVDDHALFRDGLRHVLNDLAADTRILEAADFDRALKHMEAHPDLDLVLLDLNMPGKSGFTTLDTLAKKFPALPVVIVSASSERSDIQRALDSGAMGYIPKESTASMMLNALQLVMAGSVYVPPSLALNTDSSLSHNNSVSGLTPRQLDVLGLLVKGVSNKVIAAEMNLAEATVKMHITAILKCLGVTNRTQAALAAEKQGLVIATDSEGTI